MPGVEPLETRQLLSTSWFVASGGNDFGPGTLAQPFRTIQHAATVARNGDHVEIRAGVYRETVKPARDGVTFEAYDGESVTVSGADPVADWSNAGGNVYRAAQPWDLGEGNNQVFVDGRMINEARWPNTSLDVSHPTLAHVQRYAGGVIYDSNLTQPAGFWRGAIIHITPGQEWVDYTGKVLDSGVGWIRVSLPPLGNDGQPVAGNRYYLFGKFEALDAPGEWYRDPTSGQLYAWMPAGDSPARHDVEAKHREYAFDLGWKANITLRGINLFAATIHTDWGTRRLTLDGINAEYLSQFAQTTNGWAPPQDAGLWLNGPDSLLENSTISYSAGDGVAIGNSGSRVTNCVIHDVDYSAGDAAGIRAYAPNTLIDHNTIYNAGRSGITHRVGRVQILYNTIHDVLLQTTDGGGTYTFGTDGQGSTVAYNQIYNITSGGYGGVGIFLDNNSSHFVVQGNVTWNVTAGLKLNYTSFDERIEDNELGAVKYSVDKSGSGFNWSGTIFRGNTFFRPTQLGYGVSLQGNVQAAGDPRPMAVTPGSNLPDKLPTPPVVTPPPPPVVPPPPPSVIPPPKSHGGKPHPKSPPPQMPPPKSGVLSARAVTQAENFSAMRGVFRYAGGVGYPGGVGCFDAGDWIRYQPLDFGTGVHTFTLQIACDRTEAGHQIQLHLDGPKGPTIGTLTVHSTGSWSHYTLQSTSVSHVTGVHTLYLVGAGGYGIGNLDWFRFA